MKIAKIILGIVFLAAALFLLPFAWGCFQVGVPWFKPIPVLFEIGLIAFGIFLIKKRQQPLSKKSKILLVLFMVFAVLTPALLDLKIHADRKALQLRAQAFLSRAIPTAILPDSEGNIGWENFGTNIFDAERQIMGDSQPLIKRYAKTGRIRWSAAIQGQFAITGEHLNFPNSDDVEKTNQEVRTWLAERNAILGAEWQMGFWQWVEDTIEMKRIIPEIAEEDQYNGWIDQLGGTWTNKNFETMSISNNGTFSARWVSPVGTNIFKGTEIFMGAASVVRVVRDIPSHILQDGDEKDIKIIHVDDHQLIYEVDGQTNSMSR